MQSSYKRLNKEFERLKNAGNDMPTLMEYDSLLHVLTLNKLQQYDEVLQFAVSKGLTRVFDIGCAYGHQSEAFVGSNVEYIGIDEEKLNFWNLDKYIYISERYPFEINASETDLAVSIMCLTWNCYLYEKEKTLEGQCEALSRDFKHVLMYMQEDRINFVKKYFKGYEKINDFMYFYN